MLKNKKSRRKYKKKSRSLKKSSVFWIFLMMACGVGIWLIHEVLYIKPADNWYEASGSADRKVSLPKDDATHQASMEWWYYNGHLRTESGKRYSFHHTVFLVSNLTTHMVSHVSLSDHQNGKHYTAQRRTGGNPSKNIKNGFDFKHGDWLMAGGNGNDRLEVNTENFNFALNLVSKQDPVYHGGDGIISLGDAGDSYYYSRTRMAISGTITIGGESEKVSGISWFDHQWGDFSVGLLSWDWFSLQLNDGVDVMIYQLRDKSNKPLLYTASISKNGVTETLLDDEFKTIPGEEWQSSQSNIVYPIEWAIDIPEKGINIKINSINKESEFDAMLTSYNVYWEGAVQVSGSHTGLGFMELYYMNAEQ